MSETTPEALERNAQNFLAYARYRFFERSQADSNGSFAKMQRHSQNRALTLDDFMTTLTTSHVAANAFYCCLGTSSLRLSILVHFACIRLPWANRPLVADSETSTDRGTGYSLVGYLPNQVLATKKLLRLTQSEPFGTIIVDLMG